MPHGASNSDVVTEPSHAKLFARTQESILGDHCAVSYAEVGRQLGMNESAVATAVHRLRVRYRASPRPVPNAGTCCRPTARRACVPVA